MAHFFHFVKNPLRRLEIIGRIFEIFINSVAISVSYNCSIILAFCPSFDFKRINACINKFGNMLNHTKVTRIKDICAVLFLINREILTRTSFLNKMIFPSARLSAIATVSISVSHIIRQNASA